jgi:hypothetical protein
MGGRRGHASVSIDPDTRDRLLSELRAWARTEFSDLHCPHPGHERYAIARPNEVPLLSGRDLSLSSGGTQDPAGIESSVHGCSVRRQAAC